MCVPFGPFGPKGVSVTLRRPLWTPANNPLFFRRVAAFCASRSAQFLGRRIFAA